MSTACRSGEPAVYTVGHLVDPTPQVFVDALTGLTAEIDPAGFASTEDFFATPFTNGYRYGAGAIPAFPARV